MAKLMASIKRVRGAHDVVAITIIVLVDSAIIFVMFSEYFNILFHVIMIVALHLASIRIHAGRALLLGKDHERLQK